MILRDMYVAMKNVFTQLYEEHVSKSEKNSKFIKNLIIILLVGGFIYVGYYGYNFYIHRKESSAQKVFAECMQELHNAKDGKGLWSDVELAFDLGYQQNTGSRLAPYFLALKAEALQQQGKSKEAIETLSSALASMGKDDDMHGLYAVKLALLKLDSDQPGTQKEGLDMLKAQAETDGSGKTIALYYMGLYNWDQNKIEEAKNYWKQLVALDENFRKQDTSKIEISDSQYVKMAQEKLDQLD